MAWRGAAVVVRGTAWAKASAMPSGNLSSRWKFRNRKMFYRNGLMWIVGKRDAAKTGEIGGPGAPPEMHPRTAEVRSRRDALNNGLEKTSLARGASLRR